MLGCVKSVHPGVKSLWEFHQAADPTRIAVGHDGCGPRYVSLQSAFSTHPIRWMNW